MFSRANFQKPVLFDIRLNTTYQDVIILKNSTSNNQLNKIQGTLIISNTEAIYLKKINLKLVGTFKLEFYEVFGKSQHTIPVKQEKIIFECIWNNLLTDPTGTIITDINGTTATTAERNCNDLDISSQQDDVDLLRPDTLCSKQIPERLISSRRTNGNWKLKKRMFKLRMPKPGVKEECENEETTSFLGNLNDTSLERNDLLNVENGSILKDQKGFLVPEGNHLIPFEIYLSSELNETVEGNLGGTLLYIFQSNIYYYKNNGFFLNSKNEDTSKFRTNKYIRIFKSITEENQLVPESAHYAQNIPRALNFEITLHSKYISVGSLINLNFKLVKLIKTLKVMSLTISLVEYFSYIGVKNEVFNDKRKIINEVYNDSEINLNAKQSFDLKLKVPNYLKDVTQDTNSSLIKVKHKLKFKLILNNEINIVHCFPVVLFINPNVDVYGRYVAMNDQMKTHFRSIREKLFDENVISINGEELDPSTLQGLDFSDPLFHNNEGFFNNENNNKILAAMAPPRYDKSRYDKKLSVHDDGDDTSENESAVCGPENQNDISNYPAMDEALNSEINLNANRDSGCELHTIFSTSSASQLSENTGSISEGIRNANIQKMCQVPTYDEAVKAKQRRHIVSPNYFE